jgi:hypothetical protein
MNLARGDAVRTKEKVSLTAAATDSGFSDASPVAPNMMTRSSSGSNSLRAFSPKVVPLYPRAT